MAAIKIANPGAEVTRSQAALAVNICAARGLQDVLRPTLGPKGALKMWDAARVCGVSRLTLILMLISENLWAMLRHLDTRFPLSHSCS
jgi:hypothetical protein